jgi:hypothetical protein
MKRFRILDILGIFRFRRGLGNQELTEARYFVTSSGIIDVDAVVRSTIKELAFQERCSSR